MTLQIKQTEDSGYTSYKFNANNTEYEVLTDDGIIFVVWSARKGLISRTTPVVYDNIDDMAKRSKALLHLSILIKADLAKVPH